jgi:hypothetical protein
MTEETKEIAVTENTPLESVPKFIAEAMLLAGKGTFDPAGPGLRERCFITQDASLFGCLIDELFDSFLVALPSVISVDSESGKSSGRLVPECRVLRLMKSQVESVVIPNSQQQYFYMKHLSTLFDWMPDFFNEEKIEYIKYWMNHFETYHPEKTKFSMTSEVTNRRDVGLGWEIPENASDKSFQYLYAGTTKQ